MRELCGCVPLVPWPAQEKGCKFRTDPHTTVHCTNKCTSQDRIMKRFRLILAALLVSVATTACTSDLVGPEPGAPSYDRGEGGFGSGG